MTKIPPNGPRPSKVSSPASGRSSAKRGSFTRNRSRQMDTLVAILAAVSKLGVGGKEFSTSELREKVGCSRSQAYTWLQVLRTHGFVSARLISTRRPSGDWRWKRRFKITRIK